MTKNPAVKLGKYTNSDNFRGLKLAHLAVHWSIFHLGAVLCLKFVLHGFPLVLGFWIIYTWVKIVFPKIYQLLCDSMPDFQGIYHHYIAIWTCPNLRRFTNTIIYGSEAWDFGELDSQQPAIRGSEWVSSG